MRRLFLVREVRQRDPRVIGPVSGAPNDVCNTEHAPILQAGVTLDLTDDPRRTLDACFREIARMHPDQRSALARVDIRHQSSAEAALGG
ncbi:MAG TPA: hypothetical protein VI217_19175, partial [Mycobacterium sp.]